MAFKDEINYETISQINKKERKNARLTNLDLEFYPALIKHLKTLQEEYNKRYLESPTSTEALLLNNEICKLDSIIKEIYSRRERKVLLSAIDTGSTPNFKTMLEHEQRFYSEIVKILKGFREEILNQKPNPICDQIEHSIEPRTELTTKTSEVAAGDEVKNEPGRETTIKTEDELEAEPEQIVQLDSEIDQGTPEDNSEQVLVQVLEDIEQFVGTDLITYNLHKEDLATIPKEIAQILQNNNKVRVVEPNL